MHLGIIPQVILFLALAAVITPVCHRLKVSPILGYLAAGILVGPHALGMAHEDDQSRNLAELGVAFLLFMIGLELSLDRLKAMRHLFFGLGGLQVVVTGALAGTALFALGLPAAGAGILGIGLALSSTAFVLQSLTERGEHHGRVGHTAVAILVLQDLAVIPVLMLIPKLGGDAASLPLALAASLAKAAGAMALIFVIAHLVLRPVFRVVAVTKAPEAFVALAMLTVIGTGFATSTLGLSYALGAFLAGMMLATSEYRHQIEADLLPVRGLLMGLFFLNAGMSISPVATLQHLGPVVAGAAALLVGKALILGLIGWLLRLPNDVALHLALLLAQGGEFALVIASQAGAVGVIPTATVELVSAMVILSMATTPALAWAGSRLSHWRLIADASRHAPDESTGEYADHVIICGYGRVGRTVGAVLAEQGISFLAIDRNPQVVTEMKAKDEPIFFGDIRNIQVLNAVGISRARAVVITIDSGSSRGKLLARLTSHYPGVRVLVRARDQYHARTLATLGAIAVVPETMEGSLRLAALALETLGTPASEIDGIIEEYRTNDYARLADRPPETIPKTPPTQTGEDEPPHSQPKKRARG